MIDPPTNVQDVNRLIVNQTQENLHLDYKDSRAVSRSKRAEIAKDVSAFANSDGGAIIYGISEQGHLPVAMDEGVDHNQYSREWLEQVINSNISPRIEGVRIVAIPISQDRSIYAVGIPKSCRGPHQAADKRYYKRFNFQSQPMEDYEINDVRSRRTIVLPLINVDVEMRGGVATLLVIRNVGRFPAMDVTFSFPSGVTWPHDGELPKLLSEGSAVLPPGREYRFYYHTYPEMVNGKAPSTLDVEVDYYHAEADQRVTDAFHIDFMDFFKTAVTRSELYELGKTIRDALEKLTRETKKLSDRLGAMSDIASPTGLNLSVRSVANLGHVVSQDGRLEKLNPYTSDHRVFQDLLGIDLQLALDLQSYFQHRSPASALREVGGMTDEIIARLRERFSVQDENV